MLLFFTTDQEITRSLGVHNNLMESKFTCNTLNSPVSQLTSHHNQKMAQPSFLISFEDHPTPGTKKKTLNDNSQRKKYTGTEKQ